MRRLILLAAVLTLAAGAVSGAITMSNTAELAFGGLIAPSVAGSITVSPAGGRTASGVIPFGATPFGPATFTVTIDKGQKDFALLLPSSATLSDGNGNTMTVDSFISSPVAVGRVPPSTKTAVVSVGATLRVNSGQRAGNYSGSFPVTVVQQ